MLDKDNSQKKAKLSLGVINREQVREMLMGSEEKFCQLVEQTEDFIWQTDKNGVYIYCCPRVFNLFGYKPSEFLGKSPFDFMSLEEVKQEARILKSIFSERESFVSLGRKFIHKDGHEVFVECSGTPAFNDKGKFIGYRGIARDITERKKAEDKLKESENQFRTLINNYPDGVALVIDQNIIYANPALCEMTGYTAQEIVNKSPETFLVLEDKKKARKNMKRLFKEGQLCPSEYNGIKKNKTVFPLEVRSQIIEYNSKPALLCVLRDITERKKGEKKLKLFNEELEKKVKERTKELLVLNKELERANKVRADFTADASHELRTPLAVIQSNLDLALRKKSRKQISPKDTLLIINTEIKGITKIISDLSLLSRVDAKEQKVEHRKVRLDEIIKKAVKKARILGKDKDISIKSKRIDEVNILGDKDDLERLVMNLLSNAILYGKPKGTIKVKLSLTDSQTKIVVSDDGIGISKKDIPYIFDRFYRVKKDRSRESGGTGLGLAICKWIVDVHGGKIRVTSTLGKGSKFIVKLPVL